MPYYLDQLLELEYNIGRYADHAFWTTVLMDVWHWTPFVTLVMLAGLTAIPKEPMEQALVDGANRWQVLRYLTIPLMMPVILTTLFIRIMDALRIVDEVFLLTGGGPGTTTPVLSYHLYTLGWTQLRFGRAAALALLIAGVNWILIMATLRITRVEERSA